MISIEDIIKYENENTSVDFKAIEYTKSKYVDLLKDIISMANADVFGDRFIVIGVKFNSDTTRVILGLTQLTDSATIQQLVNENIEPEINIDYSPYEIDKKIIGVLKISGCSNPPYLAKKDYNSGDKYLRKGDGYIRKGSFQRPLTRLDYDRIYKVKQEASFYDGDIKIFLQGDIEEDEILLKRVGQIKLPSDIQKENIEKILTNKKKESDWYKNLGAQFDPEHFNVRRTISLSLGHGIPYEDYTVRELEKELLDIKNIYYNEDCYYIFEEKSNMINLSIRNCGSRYIEDATFFMFFPKIEGVMISDEIFPHPSKSKNINYNLYYPKVTQTKSHICVESSIGDIKHGLASDAFRENLRIFVANNVDVSEFDVECRLYGKNIKDYILKVLKVKVFGNAAIVKNI